MRAAWLAVGLLTVVGCGRKPAEEGTPPEPAAPVQLPQVRSGDGRPPASPPARSVGKADPYTARQPVDDKYPLPQNLEKAKKARADEEAAIRAATVGVFDKGPGAKAPWADAARAAMEAYARRFGRGLTGADHHDFLAAVQAATDAGCDDPLVRYWQVRFVDRDGPDGKWNPLPPADAAARFREVLRQLPAAPYPPEVRVHGVWNSYVYLQMAERDEPGVARPGEVAAAERAFWEVFGELAEEETRRSRGEVYDLAGLVMTDYHERGGGWEAGWRKVDRVLRGAKAAGWLRLAVEGDYLIHSAWDARGSGYADTVTPEGWVLFKERLGKARDRLGRAWEAEPTFAPAAAAMVTVAMGLGLPRDEMEVWFRRAMGADPDCLRACEAKLEYLKPKWHGTPEDERDFRLQCCRTGNWYARLPFLLDVSNLGGPEGSAVGPQNQAYYRHPAAQVDLRAVYGTYLELHPGDRWTRTRYAAMLVTGGRAAEAAPHFEALGDRPWTWVFPTRATYEQYRARALAVRPKKGDR